jgi:hypothetical protein
VRRTAAFAISAALLPAALSLGACSGSPAAPKAAGTASGPAAAPTTATPSVPAGPQAPPPSAPPGAPLLTGTQLKGALLPASYFPSGFTNVAAETQDTGDGYEKQSTTRPAAVQCPLFDTNGIVTITGYSPVSFAQSDYQSKAGSAEYAQEIDVFEGAASQGLMSTLSLAASACSTYQDSETSTTAQVEQTATAVGGEPALVFLTTDPAWPGGVTIEAVRVGTAVVTVMASTGSADNGTREAAKLAAAIVANLVGKS